MSPYRGGWEPGDRFPPRAKQPPPKHGIKLNKIGASWWGLRWIEALERVLGGDSGRLSRGRTYARAGRTHDLVVRDGKVRALVTGSRVDPYEVSIALGTLTPETWQRVVAAMATKAQFAAELLAGQMPKDLAAVFHAAGTSLFPRDRADLVTSCSCPDSGDPCKHVAATHYVLGEALDQDPFLLFELRGRTKAQVLEALRFERGSVQTAARGQRRSRSKRVPDPAARGPRPALSEADYDRAAGPAPALAFCFEAPDTQGALLRQLGTPAGWKGDQPPADSLFALVRTAAERARAIALQQQDEPEVLLPERGGCAPPKPKPGR